MPIKINQTLLFAGMFLLIFIIGMYHIPLMEHDATQYATMGMQMLQNGDWLQIYWRTVSYLDKPPLIFWTSAVSFAVMDYSHFAYRLPSVLVLLLGIYSLYRLALNYLDEARALLVPMVFVSFVAAPLMWLDVRTDTMLTGWIAFTLWQTDRWLNEQKIKNLIGLSVGIGFSLLTKGPIGLMVPLLAFGFDMLMQKKLSLLINKDLWLIPVIVGLMLLPMLIGLYLQHGTTGVKFYFWTQSFGRLTGENVWRDESGPLFFVHTLLWLSLPWTLFLLRGLWLYAKGIFQGRLKQGGFLFWGFVLPFIAFSLSTYKLPHYLYVILPFAAILVVHGLSAQSGGGLNFILKVQHIVLLLMVLLVLAMTYVLGYTALFVFLVVGFISIIVYFKFKSVSLLERALSGSLIIMLMVNSFLVFGFYPELLRYQAGSKVALRLNELYDPRVPRCFYNQHRPAFDFYSHEIVPDFKSIHQIDSALTLHPVWYVFTNFQGVKSLDQEGYELIEMETFADIKVTQLSALYLTESGRQQMADTIYILRISRLDSVAQR